MSHVIGSSFPQLPTVSYLPTESVREAEKEQKEASALLNKLNDYSALKNHILYEAAPDFVERAQMLIEKYNIQMIKITLDKVLALGSAEAIERSLMRLQTLYRFDPLQLDVFNPLQLACIDTTINNHDRRRLIECLVRLGLTIHVPASLSSTLTKELDKCFFKKLYMFFDAASSREIILKPRETILAMLQGGISFREKPEWLETLVEFAFFGICSIWDEGIIRKIGYFHGLTQKDEKSLAEIFRLGLEQGCDFNNKPEETIRNSLSQFFQPVYYYTVHRICLLADCNFSKKNWSIVDREVKAVIERAFTIKKDHVTAITTYIENACTQVFASRMELMACSHTTCSLAAVPVRVIRVIADYVFTEEAYKSQELRPRVMPALFNMRMMMATAEPPFLPEANEKVDNEINTLMATEHFEKYLVARALDNYKNLHDLVLYASKSAIIHTRILDLMIPLSKWPQDLSTCFTFLFERMMQEPSISKSDFSQIIKFISDLNEKHHEHLVNNDRLNINHPPANFCVRIREFTLDRINRSPLTEMSLRHYADWLLLLCESNFLSIDNVMHIISLFETKISPQELFQLADAVLKGAIAKDIQFQHPIDQTFWLNNGIGWDSAANLRMYAPLIRLMTFAGAQLTYDWTFRSGCYENIFYQARTLRIFTIDSTYNHLTLTAKKILQNTWQSCPAPLAEMIMSYTLNKASFSNELISQHSLAVYNACVQEDEKETRARAEQDQHVIQRVQALNKVKQYSDSELSLHFGIANGPGDVAKGVFQNHLGINPNIQALSQFMEGNYLIIVQMQEKEKLANCVVIKRNANTILQYCDSVNNLFRELNQTELNRFKLTVQDRFVQLDIGINAQNMHQYTYATPTIGAIPAPDKFYQEVQVGSLCGYHSLNAFHGDRICSLMDYLRLSLVYTQRALQLQAEELQKVGSNFTPLEGADPRILQNILHHPCEPNKLPLAYRDVVIETLSKVDMKRLGEAPDWKQLSEKLSHPSVDRIIVGWAAKHFVALRKRSDGRWHVVDSQNPNSQNRDYKSVEDCLVQYRSREHDGTPTHFSFLYIAPKIF